MKRTAPLWLYLTLFFATLTASGVDKQSRTWQPVDSNDIEGTLISATDAEVVLELGDGSEVILDRSTLGTRDLRYLVNVEEAVNPFRSWRLSNIPSHLDFVSTRLTGSFVETRGQQNNLSDTYVVLILNDFTRRAYPLNKFSSSDQAYVAEMVATEEDDDGDSSTVELQGNYDWYRPGDAGINIHETDHFVFYWGDDMDSDGTRWKNASFRQMNFDYCEDIWNFHERHNGVPLSATSDYKTNVYIFGTGLPYHGTGWAYGGDALYMHPDAMLEGSSVVPHEFTHNIQFRLGGYRDSDYVGWIWEAHANWGSHQYYPSYPPALEVYNDRAHYELTSTRMNYGSWPFLQYLTEHPQFGPWFCYRIWMEALRNDAGAATETPFETIMRLGVEDGLWTGDGLSGFGDLIGEVAAHMAYWDMTYQYVYQNTLISRRQSLSENPRDRVILQEVADRDGWYKPIYSHAPRQFGINIIELIPDEDANHVTADFQGIVDATEGSDWRVTLVAVDSTGRCRYSRMWNQGQGSIDLEDDDQHVFLTIAATPTQYTPLGFRIGFNQKRRYPYEVSFTGCTPNQDPTRDSTRTYNGHTHANGGGFVASTATVASTAYVGPNAKVLEYARVTGNARIEHYAVVREQANVSGNARVSDMAVVGGTVQLQENARVMDYAQVWGSGSVGGDALIKGFGEVYTASDTPVSGGTIMGEDLEVYLGGFGQEITYGLIYGYNTSEQLAGLEDNEYLYAEWDFDEDYDDVVRDSLADNDGVLRGAPAIFTGSRSYAALREPNQYILLQGDLVDTTNLSLDMKVCWHGQYSGTLFEFVSDSGMMSLTPSDAEGKICFTISDGETTESLQADHALDTARWTQVTLILEGDEGRLYLDGDLAAQGTLTLNPEDIQAQAGFLGRGSDVDLDYGKVFRQAFDDPQSLPGATTSRR